MQTVKAFALLVLLCIVVSKVQANCTPGTRGDCASQSAEQISSVDESPLPSNKITIPIKPGRGETEEPHPSICASNNTCVDTPVVGTRNGTKPRGEDDDGGVETLGRNRSPSQNSITTTIIAKSKKGGKRPDKKQICGQKKTCATVTKIGPVTLKTAVTAEEDGTLGETLAEDTETSVLVRHSSLYTTLSKLESATEATEEDVAQTLNYVHDVLAKAYDFEGMEDE